MPPPRIATIVPDVVETALAITSSSRLDDVRQRRRQAGEEEPVDREAGEHRDVQRRCRSTSADRPGRRRRAPSRPASGWRRAGSAGAASGRAARRRTGRPGSTAAAAWRTPRRRCRPTSARSGEKKNRLASATWKTPSADCEVSRVANSRRKSRCRRTARRSPANDTRPGYGRMRGDDHVGPAHVTERERGPVRLRS